MAEAQPMVVQTEEDVEEVTEQDCLIIWNIRHTAEKIRLPLLPSAKPVEVTEGKMAETPGVAKEAKLVCCLLR